MQLQKVIIKGRLDFGSEKSFDKVLGLFQQRLEKFFKNDTLIDHETMFNREKTNFTIPRLVTQSGVKTWSHTMSAFEFLAQFAVSGNIHAFMTENGKILQKFHVEPTNEKIAVQAYQSGKSLIKCVETRQEALTHLDSAISAYDQHAMAYAKRGYVKYLLEQYEGAAKDFEKSIAFDELNPEPYIGRAMVKNINGDAVGAISTLDEALKLCFPLQSIHWKIRRIKGHLLQKENRLLEAALEFKLFLNRQFEPGDPNFSWMKIIMWDYANVLYAMDEYEDAYKWLDLIQQSTVPGRMVPEIAFLNLKATLAKLIGKPIKTEDKLRLNELTKNKITASNSSFADSIA